MQKEEYQAFIDRKSEYHQAVGLEVDDGDVPDGAYPHQADLIRWAIRKGRAAIFADTGLGKTLMELAWAKRVAREGRVLIVAPLAVATQIERESRRWGVECRYMREDDGSQIVVTNYDILDKFDASKFSGVVLDESSILKSFTGKTRNQLIEAFSRTPYRLCGTATPAPNDFTELGNHSEFLGIKTRQEMLAEYFAHDGGSTQDWRIKGHAVGAFWQWVATWGAVVRKPSDLGHDDGAYDLPPIVHHSHVVDVGIEDAHRAGFLFAPDARTLSDQRATRRATMQKRAEIAAEIANTDEPVIIWCELNDEADAVQKLIADSAQVKGADSPESKMDALIGFADGKHRVLVSKASICGFGLNWQHCARVVFMGASHSYEQTYQAVRRCWRFGQPKTVHVHTISANTEGPVIENYRRKEADAARLGEEMALHVLDSVRADVIGCSKREWNSYGANTAMTIPSWLDVAKEEARP